MIENQLRLTNIIAPTSTQAACTEELDTPSATREKKWTDHFYHKIFLRRGSLEG